MERTERFAFVLSPPEKVALHRLAAKERLPAAAVIRRLIWREAEGRGLLPDASSNHLQPAGGACSGAGSQERV